MFSYLRRSCIFLGIVSALCWSSGLSFSQVRVVYTYPSRNATQVSAKTTIGIRYTEAISKSLLTNSSFIVTGMLSGIHSGKIILAGDMRTIIFTPDILFSIGERVGVSVSPLQCESRKMTEMYNFTFQISKSKIIPHSLRRGDDYESHTLPFLSSNGPSDSLPSDFPTLEITTNIDPSPGHFYLTNFTYVNSRFGTFLMILDNSGNVLFQRKTYPLGAQNFRLQPNGLFTYFDQWANKFYGMDSNFIVCDSFAAANGYETDYRELCFLPGGGYALLGVYSEKTDMRHIIAKGDSTASVTYNVLQEFDKEKNLIFEWRSSDSGHFAISDATYQDFTLSTIDCVHSNCIEYDLHDRTFLLSSRNLDEITKIDPEDGKMIWRLGGNHNQFMFINESLPFSHQHDVHLLPNGNITLLDNGNFRNPPQTRYSRGVEYSLDENAKTITRVWEYRHDPDIYADAMGSVQRLENGNTLIGWGLCDSVAATEVQPDGRTVWEMRLPIGEYNYRVYKVINDRLRSDVIFQTVMPTISLEQNYPNPFAASSIIHFTTNGRTPVTLIVYDALGREVRTLFNSTIEAGEYSANFEARNLPNGMYICKLTTPSESLSRTLIVLK